MRQKSITNILRVWCILLICDFYALKEYLNLDTWESKGTTNQEKKKQNDNRQAQKKKLIVEWLKVKTA